MPSAHHQPEFSPDQVISQIQVAKLCNKASKLDAPPYLTDPAIYAPVKRLGSLLIAYQTADRTFNDPKTGFAMSLDDRYVIVHLSRTSKPTFQSVDASLPLVANFLETHDLTPTCIMGKTYELLGKAAARRYGFSIHSPEATVTNKLLGPLRYLAIKNIARNAGVKGKLGPMVTVYQPTDDFLARYSSR